MQKIVHDSETPAHGQQVIVPTAFIWHDFGGMVKVFLPKRAATKKFLPSVYELPGGHLDFGEDMVAGLKREIFEEFGMRIRVGDPFAAFTYHNAVKGSHSIEVTYFAQFVGSIDAIKFDPEDHSEFVWASADECEHYMTVNRAGMNEELLTARKAFELLGGGAPDFS